MVKFWSKKVVLTINTQKKFLKNIFFGLSESGSWWRFRRAFMAPKSWVQTIVMVHLSSKYGQNVVEKKIFLPKNGKINFFFVFPNSTHEDGFRELSYDLLAQKKTWFVADLSNIFLLIMTWPCFDHKFPKIIFEKYFFLVYLNQARDDGFRELSWPQKAQLKLVVRQVFK
jgi:hypothetical protein